jgi:hypothetical protein
VMFNVIMLCRVCIGEAANRSVSARLQPMKLSTYKGHFTVLLEAKTRTALRNTPLPPF